MLDAGSNKSKSVDLCRSIVGVHTNFLDYYEKLYVKQYEPGLSETAVEIGEWRFTLIASFYSFIMLFMFILSCVRTCDKAI